MNSTFEWYSPLGLKDVFFKVEREVKDVILIPMCFHKITLGNVVKGVGAV